MRMGVLGVNHKLATLQLRERLAKGCQEWVHSVFKRPSEAALVLLSTCNRTEVYFSSEDLALTHTEILMHLREEVEEEFDQKLYTYFGIDCFRHLVRVTAGLDSAIRGETEIQGQVALAYAEAAKAQSLPAELHFLFQKGLKTGKQIRTLIPFARGMPGLHDAILHIGSLFFPSVRQAKILFIGASSIHTHLIAGFKRRGMTDLTLCNRTLQRSQEVAKEHQIQVLDWSDKELWSQYDWVLCATKAQSFLLTRQQLCYPKRRQLLMDLSVPRNIDPSLKEEEFITLYDIDAIQETLGKACIDRLELFTKAEEWVEKAALRQSELFVLKQKAKKMHHAV